MLNCSKDKRFFILIKIIWAKPFCWVISQKYIYIYISQKQIYLKFSFLNLFGPAAWGWWHPGCPAPPHSPPTREYKFVYIYLYNVYITELMILPVRIILPKNKKRFPKRFGYKIFKGRNPDPVFLEGRFQTHSIRSAILVEFYY